MNTQMFNVCIHDHHYTFETLTIVYQSKVPIKQHISVTCFASIETKSRYFKIVSALADKKILELEIVPEKK